MHLDSLCDDIVEVLEPNAMYYNATKDDSTRYYIPLEAIEALSLILTSVVLPVLSNVLSDEIKSRLGAWKAKRKADPPAVAEAATQAAQGSVPEEAAIGEARAAAAAVLAEYGWPSNAADTDGARVVATLVSEVWPLRDSE